MGSQILGRPRLRPAGEIGRRTDDRRAQVRADADGDHVLRHHLAGSDARVEALRHEVGEAIVDDDLDLDIRVVRKQRPKRRQQRGTGGVIVSGDAYRA